jgi:hypothetical protein
VFYEIRRYQTRPGRRDEWVRYMEETLIPYQASKGMSIIASFTEQANEDGYVWIRRFDDEAQRVALYAAVYESDRWKHEFLPVVQELLFRDRSVITRVVPTPKSALL